MTEKPAKPDDLLLEIFEFMPEGNEWQKSHLSIEDILKLTFGQTPHS